MNYFKLFEESYKKAQEVYDCPPKSKLEFLSEYVFEFVTNDPITSRLFACKAIETCKALTENKTREYTESESNYMWYLIMCNTQFFHNRIDWGGSVRNAWWSYTTKNQNKISGSCFWYEGKQIYPLQIGHQWKLFIEDMLYFASSEATTDISGKITFFI